MSGPSEMQKQSMKMQSQIRQNAEEMSDYMSDLQKWETNVVKKDRALKSKAPKSVKVNKVETAGTVATNQHVSSSAPLTAKDNEGLTPASLVSHHSLPVVAPTAVPKATTEASKGGMEEKVREQGNAEYKRGNFAEAIKMYTKCIGLKARNYIGFSNRAMAYLKMKDYLNAEKDCSCALGIEPNHIKSYTRRAMARNALGKHRGALQDLNYCLEIISRFDANNTSSGDSKQIKADILKTSEMLRNAVNHAPLVDVQTKWLDDCDLIDATSPDEDSQSCLIVEAGPDPMPQ